MNSKISKLISIISIFILLESYHLFRTVLFYDKSLRPNYIFSIKDIISSQPNLTVDSGTKRYLRPFCKCSDTLQEYILIENKNDDKSNLVITLIQSSSNLMEIFQRKRIIFSGSWAELDRESVTCDLFNVLKRGKNQKVISYSLYGTDFKYYQSIQRILELIRIKYPGYVARIHYDNSINQTSRCIIECKNSDVVDFCNMNRFSSNIRDHIDGNDTLFKDLSYMHKMMWRFLPVGDTYIDVMMSRDTDSIFIDREIDSVKEWMSTNNYGHIMRDHPYHGVDMLGGMWGVRNVIDRESSRKIFDLVKSEEIAKKYNNNRDTPKGSDQYFLSAHVYQYLRDRATIHDSYTCRSFPGSKPFPTKRNVIDHIGSVTYLNTTRVDECPIECRPPDHKDWIYC